MNGNLSKRVVAAVLALSVGGVALAASALASPATEATGGGNEAVVQTDKGTVRGTVAGDHRLFQGIPYAAPPKGKLRWASPQPAARWSGVRDATRAAPSCPQTGDFVSDLPSLEEDCLYLNVTTPRAVQGQQPAPTLAPKLPVMVWIHGGGFYSGAGAAYGPERLATQGDVIVVTINYRLGVFGFLTHPALDGGQAKQLSGNFGLEDQQAALRWVRRNAAAFGGDPSNVTIFGESAGGMSGCAHLAAPGSAGLFDRVIMQSSPCTLRWPWEATWRARPRAFGEQQGQEIATRAGCTDPETAAACLRGKSVEDLLDASFGGLIGIGPHYGGGVLPQDPFQALRTGRIANVPVMHGITRDEHVTFQVGADLYEGPVAPEDYPETLGTYLGLSGDKLAEVVRAYPLSDYDDSTTWALASVVTDWAWGCTAVDTNRLLAKSVPTYAFEFADRDAPWFAGEQPSFPTGAYHAGELQYLFSGAYGGGELTAEQRQLSDQMISYWTRFAHGDSPWPRFRAGGGPSAGYVQTLEPGETGRYDQHGEHRCDFWSGILEG
jgi:para-nitrobenzyl esterase